MYMYSDPKGDLKSYNTNVQKKRPPKSSKNDCTEMRNKKFHVWPDNPTPTFPSVGESSHLIYDIESDLISCYLQYTVYIEK